LKRAGNFGCKERKDGRTDEGKHYLQELERERIGHLLQSVSDVHRLIKNGRQVVGVFDQNYHLGDALVQAVGSHQGEVVLHLRVRHRTQE